MSTPTTFNPDPRVVDKIIKEIICIYDLYFSNYSLNEHINPIVLLNLSLQIRQYGHLEDGSLNVVTRGQQRFRLRRCWVDVEGVVRKILCLLPF